MPLLTLLTDFGLDDWYVAAVKGVVLRSASGAQIVDISHQVPPGDVETAAFLLAAPFPTFPPGTVHLAVVDPGVGSDRRLLAARTHDASWLVAPDNGLLTCLLPEVDSLRSVERTDLFLSGPGRTFHGRDRFAPIAAALLRGEPWDSLGPVIGDPVRLAIAPPRREPGLLTGRVAHVDRYGNLVTDLPWSWLPAGPCRVEVASHTTASHATDRRVTHYAEIPPGEAAFLPGSLATVELSMNGENLACRWHVGRGARVQIATHFSPQATMKPVRG
jgi:S-adenosylmethionine hydrolase